MVIRKYPISGLRKLLEDQLSDIYFAEHELKKVLKRMARHATNSELRAAFEDHMQESHGQIERLEQVCELLGFPVRAKSCPAILGLIQECSELMDKFGDDPAIDAALIAGARKVEHYEVATYSNIVAWAAQLGSHDVVDLVQETLEEEQAADEALSDIAEDVIGTLVMADLNEEELVEVDRYSLPRSLPSIALTGQDNPANGSTKRMSSRSNGISGTKH